MIPFMVLLTSPEIFNISPVSNTSRPSMKDIASEAGTPSFYTISVVNSGRGARLVLK